MATTCSPSRQREACVICVEEKTSKSYNKIEETIDSFYDDGDRVIDYLGWNGSSPCFGAQAVLVKVKYLVINTGAETDADFYSAYISMRSPGCRLGSTRLRKKFPSVA